MQAWRSTHSPILTISPFSSASGMNCSGGNVALDRMGPAQQGLEADDPIGRQIDERLVAELELLERQSPPQIDLHFTALLQAGVHAGLEGAEPAAASPLRLVQCEIRIAQQIARLRRFGPQRHADAGSDVDRMAAQDIGSADQIDDARGEPLGSRIVLDIALQDDEFVAAETRDQIALAAGRGQAVGHLLEQKIAHRMAERIIDRLESIEIDAMDGNSGSTRILLQSRGEMGHQRVALGKSRQLVAVDGDQIRLGRRREPQIHDEAAIGKCCEP